jgi:hypothetical protein
MISFDALALEASDMGTIAVWAFFILWGLTIIQSLLYRNIALAFNLALQIYVVQQFYVGEVKMNLRTIITAIALCWGMLVITSLPRAIAQFRQERRWEREAKEKPTDQSSSRQIISKEFAMEK